MVSGDTIVASATPPGRSALAVARLSGPRALPILESIFQRRLAGDCEPWRLATGSLRDPESGEPLDTAAAVWMPAPRTYTGEDVVEITCHGSPVVMERLLGMCLRSGARMAEPGEFTRRAFENGRMDLAEAEAVCDVIASDTEAALRVARRQLTGELSAVLAGIRSRLLDLAAEIEARIDFPEEDIPEADVKRLESALRAAHDDVESLWKQGRRGRRLREGARVAIVGRVNTGKSSLFNALVGMERAISTPHPGTTRDTIEARVDLDGLAVDLVDTAGIRAARDEVEIIGIERSKAEIERADAALWIVDGSGELCPEDREVFDLACGKTGFVVVNKIDLPGRAPDNPFLEYLGEEGRSSLAPDATWRTPIRVSAQRKIGIEEIERRLKTLLLGAAAGEGGQSALVSNVRHLDALSEAREAAAAAADALAAGNSLEFVMVDLRNVIHRINSILGLDVGEEILNRIFERFCLGK